MAEWDNILAQLKTEKQIIAKAPFTFCCALLALLISIGGVMWGIMDRLYGGIIENKNSRIETLSSENGRIRVALGVDPATPTALLTLTNRELQAKAFSVAAKLRDLSREYGRRMDEIEKRKDLDEKGKFDQGLSLSKEMNQQFLREGRAEAYNIDFELRRRLGPEGVRGVVGMPELESEDGSRINILQLVAAADTLGVNMGFLNPLAFGIEQMGNRLPAKG